MNAIGKPERATQDRVIALFRGALGYCYLGNWSDRANSNIEAGLLNAWLTRRGHDGPQIARALHHLQAKATNPTRSLYDTNKAVHALLRYGIPVKAGAGEATETIWMIDWDHPEANDFAIAEEVTLKGAQERRPDLVLYVNGLALGVIELKRSAVSVGEGIRQLISNQRPEYNAPFFATAQLLLAGNDTEGLRYGTIGTPEKMFLAWKEDEADNASYKLDKYLAKLCGKARLLELVRDFVLFDGGTKKLPRPHQYFGVKAAQEHARGYRSGVIWHTQGSGKSIVMVLLARWLLERMPDARVLIVTDRDELDKQIERVFQDSGEPIARSRSGAELIAQLGRAKPRLLCSLVHKFGRHGVEDFDAMIEGLRARPSAVAGKLFVFVDECHRTQGGKLHRTMKALMPGAVFIGFTGTPLLKRDRATSNEVFGGYIHTYKFGEAIEDGVVLDLLYEARDIPQELGATAKVDQWFEAKTKGLNDWKKATLREHWGTMQKVLSSRSRMERVVADIVFDFGTKPRLASHRGNAMLVASSIYEACRYFDLFEKTGFKGHCAIVTSYSPDVQDVTKEDTGADTETEKQFVHTLYSNLLKPVQPASGKTRTETYEDDAKERFIKQPAAMRLLIVVDKLLTGFDAPSCSYLYIDKSMQDHGLFQAICRTNRLDGEDKPFGCVVDYKDLFKKVQGAISVYASELDGSDGGTSSEILLHERLAKGRERLEAAREAVTLLCEDVELPQGELQYIHHFCGNTEIPDDLQAREPQRTALYNCVANLVRAYAAISGELAEAGYSLTDAKQAEDEAVRAVKLRETIRQASGETLDLKPFEADMRHLIDTYIKADEARPISDFEGVGLLELIVKSGVAAAVSGLPPGIKRDKDAVAETIANNVRSKIIKEKVNDPAFYNSMAALLKDVLADLRAHRITYEEFLHKIASLAVQVQSGKTDETPPALDTPGKRALYNNLGQDEALALAVDAEVKRIRPDGWKGNQAKESIIKKALLPLLSDVKEVERIFAIIRAQADY